MNYQTKIIAGVKFTPAALYKLDCMKWENEARIRLQRMRAEYARTGKILIINLRPRPTQGGQTTLC